MEITYDDNEPTVPVEDTMLAQMDAFQARLNKLQEEALSFGFTSVGILCCYDPIGKTTYRCYQTHGSIYETIGVLEDTLLRLKMGERESRE